VAGRLCYVPDEAGQLVIDGRTYRKVALHEAPVLSDYPVVSSFARDVVYLVPLKDVERVWDPFAVSLHGVCALVPDVQSLIERLAAAVLPLKAGKVGVIGSHLVAPQQPHPGSDVDLAVSGVGAWSATATLVHQLVRAGAVHLAPDDHYAEFAARAAELRLEQDALRALRRTQWWRKLQIGGALVSFSLAGGLGRLPQAPTAISAAEVHAVADSEAGGCAPYAVLSRNSSGPVAGALHLSWHLRHGFSGRVRGPLVQIDGRPWIWASQPDQIELDPFVES
jgi:hypothetical protein